MTVSGNSIANHVNLLTTDLLKTIGNQFWIQCSLCTEAPVEDIVQFFDRSQRIVYDNMGGPDEVDKNLDDFFARRGQLIIDIIKKNKDVQKAPLFQFSKWILMKLKSFCVKEKLHIFSKSVSGVTVDSVPLLSDYQLGVQNSLADNNKWTELRFVVDGILTTRPDIQRLDIYPNGNCFIDIIATDEGIEDISECR
jgi:hypothetical protein